MNIYVLPPHLGFDPSNNDHLFQHQEDPAFPAHIAPSVDVVTYRFASALQRVYYLVNPGYANGPDTCPPEVRLIGCGGCHTRSPGLALSSTDVQQRHASSGASCRNCGNCSVQGSSYLYRRPMWCVARWHDGGCIGPRQTSRVYARSQARWLVESGTSYLYSVEARAPRNVFASLLLCKHRLSASTPLSARPFRLNASPGESAMREYHGFSWW